MLLLASLLHINNKEFGAFVERGSILNMSGGNHFIQSRRVMKKKKEHFSY